MHHNMNVSRRTIAFLIVVVIVMQVVTLYYNPLLQMQRAANLDPVQIFAKSNRSVVTVRAVAIAPTSSVVATGFVISYDNSYYVVTNFHVVDGVLNTTVTFSNGNSYRAEILGTDAYSDLAILSVKSPSVELTPLRLGSSSNLRVGESVVAIGNPFGLSSSITVGIVSQVGRILQSETSGSFPIADTIQFSAAINPGNSGGPLINADGTVVGITTAIISGSQGLGFAIPSDMIVRELPFLVKTGKYDRHPYLGLQLADMNYPLALVMKTNITWGALIQSIVVDGPANKSGLRGGTQRVAIEGQRYIVGGDIILSIDGNRIVDFNALSVYMERHVIPGQTIQVEIIRLGKRMMILVEVGSRPPIR